MDTQKMVLILTPEHLETVLQNEGKGAKAMFLTDHQTLRRVYPRKNFKGH
jgi:aminotransferase